MALLLTVATGAWAQDPDPIDLTPSADGTVWTLSTMPEYDVELEVTYYTDEEVAEMEEAAAYTEGVELTPSADGKTWTLAAMPGFDVELEVTYYDELIDNADNNTLLESLDGQTTDIYLDRTLGTEKWYTLCLPFSVDLTADGPLKGLMAKTLSSVVNDGTKLTVTFSEAVTAIEAGKPYIVRLPEDATIDIVDPLFEGVTISKTLHDVEVAGATFKGTYAPVVLPKPDTKKLFLQNNMLYYPWTDDATINAFRAYIVLDMDVPTTAGAPNIVLNFDDDTATGITNTDFTDKDSSDSYNSCSKDNAWYDLQGRKTAKGQQPKAKGVYIHNGRKEVVR